LAFTALPAQNADPEYWRVQAFQSKTEGNFARAILQYQQILRADSSDYDARLALGRLYVRTGNIDSAQLFFSMIYANDSTDVEALSGLGECYRITGKYKKAIHCYERALLLLPGNAPLRLSLAMVYGYDGRLDDAIALYQQINAGDSTWSESWAGLGKMYYWKGMPHKADQYYQRALALDPHNEELLADYDKIREEVRGAVSLKVRPLSEVEESYEINAITSSLKIEKRLNDNFHLDGNILVDYSHRSYTNNMADTTRWYNNAWLKASLLLQRHKFSLYGGYSASDATVTPLGGSWMVSTTLGGISLKNTLSGGYDYFYYWNKVGAKSVNEDIMLGYGIFKLSARVAAGRVDAVLIKDVLADTAYVDNNDYQSYGASLGAKVITAPDITLSLNYSYLDYRYKSPMYYSPFGRKLAGASVSLYHKMKHFYIYGYFAYNIGNEYNYEYITDHYEPVDLKVDNWSTELEAGYKFDPFTLSLGYSRFHNPYYESASVFIQLKSLF
jgi:tetratricopeptide (TPR) repeat protein